MDDRERWKGRGLRESGSEREEAADEEVEITLVALHCCTVRLPPPPEGVIMKEARAMGPYRAQALEVHILSRSRWCRW